MADDMWTPEDADASGLDQTGERLRARIAEMEAAQAGLLRRLASKAEEAARSAERARLHAAEAATARKHLAHSQAHIEALLASTSWRLTAPLRTVAAPLRARIVARRPPPAPHPGAAPAAPRERRPAGAAPRFPLPGDVAAHPALLSAALPPLADRVSVIIPTWNAGAEFPWLIRKLRAQRGLGGVEIITVDSGSSDGTPERAASLGCRVIPIAPADFSHSGARNLGASVATGDLLMFMVQDAYPIGDDWLAGLARCLRCPAREEDRLAALSCAEFSRADSELIYDWMARGHYEFLGCAETDRVGQLTTLDHLGLRQQGQLSDVACLIPRALFEDFRFEGRYAEDLTLGIRLIKAGHQLGMLSSIRVAHSHNRTAGYYARRAFVDVAFLADAFPDTALPAGHEPVGAVMAADALAGLLPRLAADPRATPARALERIIDRLREEKLARAVSPAAAADFGFAPLGDWIARLVAARGPVGRALSPVEQRGALALRDDVVARLLSLHRAVEEAWPVADEPAMAELSAALGKVLAMSLGSQLAACHLSDAARGGRDAMLAELKQLLLAGI